MLIVGSPACGKSTLAARLAAEWSLDHVELDALRFVGPGWEQAPEDELTRRFNEAIRKERRAIAGNVNQRHWWSHNDLIIWLDLPIRVWLPRLVRRSIRRVRTQEPLWGGSVERARDVFHWNPERSLIVYALLSGGRRRRRYEDFVRREFAPELWRVRSNAEVDRRLAELGRHT